MYWSAEDDDEDGDDEVDDIEFDKHVPVVSHVNFGNPAGDARSSGTSDDDDSFNNTFPPVFSSSSAGEVEVELVDHPTSNVSASSRNHMSIEEAWKCKQFIEGRRQSKKRSTEVYSFVYSTLRCGNCCEYGSTNIPIGDEKYIQACLGTKWFDTEFITGFAALLAHDAHTNAPAFAGDNHGRVRMIHCPYPQAKVYRDNVTVCDKRITHLLLIAFSRDHFSVLDFDLHMRTVGIFDGLNYKIDTWRDHITHTLWQFGLVDVDQKPKFKYSAQSENSEKKQTFEVSFGDEAPWVCKNQHFTRQKDGHNCGPIACLKVMEVFGYIEVGAIDIIAKNVGGYRSVVMNKFSQMLEQYDHELRVEFREKVDELGNIVDEDKASSGLNCYCKSKVEKESKVMECCGQKVHVDCLVSYLRHLPFCMYCSKPIEFSEEDHEKRHSQAERVEEIVETDTTDVMKLAVDEPTATNIDNASEENSLKGTFCEECREPNDVDLLTEHDSQKIDGTSPDLSEKKKQSTDDVDKSNSKESTNDDMETEEGIKTPDGKIGDVSEKAEESVEDIQRAIASAKKQMMQEISAQKAIKQRGDFLVDKGLGKGALVTLQVDYRTHSHASGLVAVVFKSNATGAALVCCEHGVITHDGSKLDYWVPSDRFVLFAGADQEANIPEQLQWVRDSVLKGKYNYESQPRISFSKYHERVIGASSPCKRGKCSCKNGCSKRCGCRVRKMDCNSSCGCSGNCNWRENETKK